VDRLEALVGELQQQAQLANACLLRRIAGSSGQAERKPISDRLTINAVFSCGFQRRYFPNLRHLL